MLLQGTGFLIVIGIPPTGRARLPCIYDDLQPTVYTDCAGFRVLFGEQKVGARLIAAF
jgi:hypothetical protein